MGAIATFRQMSRWLESPAWLEFGVITLAPFLFLGIVALLLRKNTAAMWALAATGILLSTSSIYFYTHISGDAQGGLIFVMLPIQQTVGTLIASVIAFVLWAATRRSQNGTQKDGSQPGV